MEIPMRVIVSACVTDIAGPPQGRHNTLGKAFCEEVLNREFLAPLQPTGYDHVHIPADFDTTKPVKRWFIFDLNVRGELDAAEVAQIPHRVYLASRQGDKWTFIPRPQWVESAKLRASSYTWGGRLEQKIVAGMQNSLIQS
ncbi:hypothetical protein BBP40_006726 [Aspergillus hancockii]|nr:hypothetical protein BBP40_006726 [Aspergillus hancockii]